jgi:alpha-galactosidase
MSRLMSLIDDPFIVLTAANCSVVLELDAKNAPLWRHWGARLPEGALPPSRLKAARPLPSFSLDDDFPLSMFPTFGVGWFGAPALLAHRGGRSFAQAFTDCKVQWVRQNQAVTFTLTDTIGEIEIAISLDLDPENDVLTVETSLTNLGSEILDVQWLAAACLPLPDQAKSVRSYTGRHNHEFMAVDDTLSTSTWLRENRRGLTSHDCLPGAIVQTDTDSQTFGAQLAWSGNHSQRIDTISDGRYCWQMGEWLAPGEIRLAAGQSVKTPQVLATFSTHGTNGVAQNFHAAMRARMSWPSGTMKPRPVHFNTWEGVYFDLKEDALMAMATGAAALGVERFVLDDGWFHGRRADNAGLGDWWVDTDVFPDGLGPLAKHVTDLGMEFGLWVEPEMVNPDSELYRAHPDWALHLAGRPMLTARNQLVLDLTKQEVRDYLIGHLGKLLTELPISYLKWDHNRDLTTAGSAGRPVYHEQVLGAYNLFDAIRAGWPDVEIEACSGGGGRIDGGILTRTHRFWTSDCIDAVSRVDIQRGFLQFFPPEVMGSHIGTSPAHTTGRGQSTDFRGAVALGGHFGIELDPRYLNAGDRTRVQKWVAIYKAQRETLHNGKLWQGDAGDDVVWQAQGSEADFVLSVFRCDPTGQRWPPTVRLPFVNQGQTYKATLVHAPAFFGPNDGAVFSALEVGELTIEGGWLATCGLALPAMKGESALIIRMTAVAR